MMRARETAQGDGIYYTTRRARVWIYSTTINVIMGLRQGILGASRLVRLVESTISEFK